MKKTKCLLKTFNDVGFSVSTPCKLEDVSSKYSGDFVINYGGVENPNNDNDMAAYQVVVTNFLLTINVYLKLSLSN